MPLPPWFKFWRAICWARMRQRISIQGKKTISMKVVRAHVKASPQYSPQVFRHLPTTNTISFHKRLQKTKYLSCISVNKTSVFIGSFSFYSCYWSVSEEKDRLSKLLSEIKSFWEKQSTNQSCQIFISNFSCPHILISQSWNFHFEYHGAPRTRKFHKMFKIWKAWNIIPQNNIHNLKSYNDSKKK